MSRCQSETVVSHAADADVVIALSTLPPLFSSTCLFAHISRVTAHPNFTKCSVHVACGRGSVLLW